MNMHRISIITLAFTFAAGAAFADAPQKVGVVGSANASAFATGQDKAKRSLKTGDDVFLNDTIETDTKGATQIMFLDKSALTVNPNSKVTIDKFIYNPATSVGEMSLNSAKGAMRFIGGALSKKQPVNIKTPVATIGIRGGIANVGTNPQTGIAEGVFVYGREMTSTNANGETVSTTQMGSGFSVDSSGMQQSMSPAEVAANLSAFNANTVTGSTPGSLSDSVDSRVDSSVGGSSGGSGNSGGSSGEGSGGSSDSGSSDNGSSSSASSDSGGTGGGTVLASDGPDEGAAFGPDRMSQGALGDLPPTQDMTGSATQDSLRETADNIVNPDGVNLPGLPSDGTAGATDGTAFPTNIQVTDATNPDEGTNTNTSSITPTGGGSGTGPAPVTYTHNGMFSVRHGISPSDTSAMGANDLYVGVGGRLVGNFTDKVIVPGTTVNDAYIDVPASSVFNSTTIHAHGDGEDYSDVGLGTGVFLSPNGSMIYYRLRNDDTINNPGETFTMLTGQRIAYADINNAAMATRSASGATSGVSLYDFLPDVNRYDAGTAASFGAFNYNMANINLVTAPTLAGMVAGTNSLSANIGLAVDWETGNYFTGHLNWGNNTTPGGFTSAFGKVNLTPGAGSPVLYGGMFKFLPKFYDGTNSYMATSDSGATRVMNDVYGKPVSGTTTVDGMMFEAAVQPATPMPVNQLFDYANNPPANQGRQGVTLNTAAPSVTPHNTALMNELGKTRTDGVMKGFAAGVIVRDAGGTPTHERVWNTDVNNLTITRNVSSNTVGATIKVFDQAAPTMETQAKFGADAGDQRQSFTRDQVYAMGQGSMDNIASGTGTATTNAKAGVLASAHTLANAPNLYTPDPTKQYAHWGVWAAEVDRNGTQKDVVNMVPYVAGEVTPTAYTPAGNLNYAGGVLATKTVSGGTIESDTGTFGMAVNLNTRTVNVTSLTIPNFGVTGVTGSGAMDSTEQYFQGVSLTGGGMIGGTMNGAVFGPTAENVGGNFSADYSAGVNVTGVFVGQR